MHKIVTQTFTRANKKKDFVHHKLSQPNRLSPKADIKQITNRNNLGRTVDLRSKVNPDSEMKPEELDEILKSVDTSVKALTNNLAKKAREQVESEIKKLGNPLTLDTGNKLQEITSAINELEGKLDSSERYDGIRFSTFGGRGGEDPHKFMRQFEDICSVRNIKDEKKILTFKLLLQKTASYWYEENCKLITDDLIKTAQEKWEEVKEKFLKNFARTNLFIEDHLAQFLTQGGDEQVQTYFSRVLEKSSLLKKSKSETLGMFLRGLENNVKMYTLAREPADIEAALRLAKTAEDLQQISNVSTGDQHVNTIGEITPVKQLPKSDSSREVISEIKRLNDSLETVKRALHQQRQAQPQFNTIRRTGGCTFCGTPGHALVNCRKRLDELQKLRSSGQYNPGRPRVNFSNFATGPQRVNNGPPQMGSRNVYGGARPKILGNQGNNRPNHLN